VKHRDTPTNPILSTNAFLLQLLDLKKLPLFDAYMASLPHPINCCYAVRYMNRPLFSHLSSNLPIGCVFALSHFVVDLDGTFNYDHPSISDVLKLGEMEGMFKCVEEGGDWKILRNDR
jgi:hypothetical protein